MCSETTSTTVNRLPDDGMIALRADLSDAAVGAALAGAGLALPEMRQIVSIETTRIAWMSPDELLILCAPEAVDRLLGQISEAFGDLHHMAVSIGGARVRFQVQGPAADLVLARLSPVDLARFPKGEIRRSRLAQIPTAFWRDTSDSLSVICFRSVGDYAQGALENAAQHTEAVTLP